MNRHTPYIIVTIIIVVAMIVYSLIVPDAFEHNPGLYFAVTFILMGWWAIRLIASEHAKYEELNETIKEKEILLHSVAHGFASAYAVNLNTDNFDVVKQKEDGYTIFGGHRSFSKYYQKTLEKDIYEADRALVRKHTSTDVIKNNIQTHASYSIEYRAWVGKNLVWHEMTIVKIKDDDVLIGFNAKDDEILMRHFDRAAINDFFGLYVANLDVDQLNVLKESGLTNTSATVLPYTETLKQMAEEETGEAKELYTKLSDPHKAKELLKEDDRQELTYRTTSYGMNGALVKCTTYVLSRIDGEASTIAICYSKVDSIQQNKERNQMINNMSSGELLCVVDTSSDTFEAISRSKHFEENYPVTGSFSKVLEKYLINDVLEADRDKMRKASTVAEMQKQLISQDKYEVFYRDISTGTPFWYRMRVVKISDHEMLLNLTNRDEAFVEESLQAHRVKDYFSLNVVDIDTATIRSIRDSERYPSGLIGKSAPYKETIMKFAEHLDGEAKEYFLNISDLDYIKKEFATEDKHAHSYMSAIAGKWVTTTSYVISRHEDGTPAVFTLGFRLTDSLHVRSLELSQEIKERKQQLQDALFMAQSANRAKETFLSNMNRDTRTPLNAIIGFTELATSHIDNTEQVKEYLGKISKSSYNLLALINDVLDLSRIESGKMNLKEKGEDLIEILQTLYFTTLNSVKEKNLKFTIEKNIKDKNVVCDSLRLNQVLLNILSNSIKYSNEGGEISMNITEKEVSETGYGRYEFRIKDNGIGIEKELLKSIFDPFTQADSATVAKLQGTGLGIAITKNIVEMMGGKIEMDSDLGKGTETIVTFDFKLYEAPEVPDNQEEESPVSDDFFVGKKVLLVEDNELNREIAVAILEEIGVLVNHAADGDIAVNMVKEAKAGDWDVILMDIQMPTMDGYEATRQIRALDTEISKIPIFAMTANAADEYRELALEAGMNEHLTKPINIKQLKATMARYLLKK